jgi:hypothetical protein
MNKTKVKFKVKIKSEIKSIKMLISKPQLGSGERYPRRALDTRYIGEDIENHCGG